MKASVFSGKIVEWYQEHRRRLPWRATKDPYRIWLSEVILQQTRVAQGLPYYHAFLKGYPTVRALAAADEQSVLRLWQGLGYYTRARNLHACAKSIVTAYGGKFPPTYEELRKLKGVGDYTAAALASFAFDEPVAVVDGNVYRVLSRVFGITDDIMSPAGRKKFKALADRLLPKSNAATHNQAIMEFGALHCTPRNPKCDDCALKNACVARRQGIQSKLPLKSRQKRPGRRNFYYFVVRKDNKWMMKQRTAKDIWKGLWDFPLYEGGARVTTKDLSRIMPASVRQFMPLRVLTVRRHVLTHQIIHAHFVEAEFPSGKQLPNEAPFARARFFTEAALARLPKPVLVSRFLEQMPRK